MGAIGTAIALQVDVEQKTVIGVNAWPILVCSTWLSVLHRLLTVTVQAISMHIPLELPVIGRRAEHLVCSISSPCRRSCHWSNAARRVLAATHAIIGSRNEVYGECTNDPLSSLA